MKKLFSIFSSNLFFFLFFSLIALSVNYAPAVHHFLITPSDRVYTGSIFYSDDYAVYASVIQQGIDGNSGVVNKYTSEPHQPSLIRLSYLLLGKIGGTLGLTSILTYHLSRLTLGIIFLLLCLYLILNFIPKNLQRLSFLFLLFSGSWPKFDLNNPILWLKIQPLYLEPDPVVRFATQPHFQIGTIYSVLAIIFFISFYKNNKGVDTLSNAKRVARVERLPTARSDYEHWREGNPRQDPLGLTGRAPDRTRLGWEWTGPNLARLCAFLIFTAFAVLTDPPQVLVIHLALLFFVLYLIFQNLINKVSIFRERNKTSSNRLSRQENYLLFYKSMFGLLIPTKQRGFVLRSNQKQIFIAYLLTIAATIPPLLYIRFIFSQKPWVNIFPYFENLRAFPETFHDFFLSFGPVALFAIIGMAILLIPAIRNRFKLYIVNCLPRAESRGKLYILIFWLLSSLILIFILYSPLHINRLRLFHSPLYIPISIFAAYGIISISKIISKKTKIHNLFLVLSSLFLVLTVSLPVSTASLISQLKEHPTASALIYPPKTHVEAYDFLKQNTNRNDVVLCLYEACNQIPYFSGNTVFSGNITETLNQPGKSALAQEIFEGKKESLELQRILTEFRIKYIFLGYQETVWQTDFAKYPFLQKVYQNPGTSIFKVL